MFEVWVQQQQLNDWWTVYKKTNKFKMFRLSYSQRYLVLGLVGLLGLGLVVSSETDNNFKYPYCNG